MTLRVFPVANAAGVHFSDDFGVPREGGRSHAGNDLFAPERTPVLAVDDGRVRFEVDPIGGLSFYLHANDGTTYYGTHLSGTEGSPRAVRAGEVVGYVGHGGNAANTPPHLHFEVHPAGQKAVNPFPLLQRAERRDAPTSTSFPWLLTLGLAAGAGYLYWRGHGVPRGLARLLHV